MPETPRVTSLVLDVPGWAGHRPGQHVDVRLTAEDGYQAQRSYSIATPAGRRARRPHRGGARGRRGLALPDGGAAARRPLRAARPDRRLLRLGRLRGRPAPPRRRRLGRRAADGDAPPPGGGGLDVPATLLYSSRTLEDVIYREELDGLAAPIRPPGRAHAHARPAGGLGRATRGASTARCSPRSSAAATRRRPRSSAARRASSRWPRTAWSA